MNNRLPLLWVWLLLQPSASAKVTGIEAPALRFAHISFGEGPSHSSVRQTIQDDYGFLWFGTQDGLKRFDGYRIREYHSGQPNQIGISGTTVSALFKDRNGYIWVAADRYIDRYDPSSEKFHRLHFDRGNPSTVNDIMQDSAGLIWLSTTDGLCRFDVTTGKSIYYEHADQDPTSLSATFIKATLEQSDGTFWVLTTKGLDLFDRRSGGVTGRIPLPESGSPQWVATRVHLLSDHLGVVWVTLPFGSGLASVDRQSMKLISHSMKGISYNNPAEAILEDKGGNLFLGSENGLFKIERDRKTFTQYRHSPADPDSLSADQVRSLFEDREGNIWVGTQGGGVTRIPGRTQPFVNYRHQPQNANSIERDEVTSVYEDSHGMVWVGNRVALNRIDRGTGRVTIYHQTSGSGGLSSG